MRTGRAANQLAGIRAAVAVGTAAVLVVQLGCADAASPAQRHPAQPRGRAVAFAASSTGPYPDTLRYVRPAYRSARIVTRRCPDGSSAPVLSAVLGTGRGNSERGELRTLVLCRSGVIPLGHARPGVLWARDAGHDYAAVEVSAADGTSHVALIHDGRLRLVGHLGGYATSRPVPFDNGSFTYQSSVTRGMQISLRTARGRIERLGTTGTFYGGGQYTPSGHEFVALSDTEIAGSDVAAKLLIASRASKTRTVRVPIAAVNLLVLDDGHAMIAGASDEPNGHTFIVNLRTGSEEQLPAGYYPLAQDSQPRQVLMTSFNGHLFWMSHTSRSLTPIPTGAVTGGWRVVGGDLARVA